MMAYKAKHYTETLACECGRRFRSVTAHAYHKRNFPMLCRRNKGEARIPARTALKWRKEAKALSGHSARYAGLGLIDEAHAIAQAASLLDRIATEALDKAGYKGTPT